MTKPCSTPELLARPRVYASQLRKELGDDPDHPRLVTEPGVGCRLVDPGAG